MKYSVMRIVISCFVVVAGSAITGTVSSQEHQTDRLLSSGDGYRMTLRESACQRLMNVDIRADRPDILRPDNKRLNRILAVARAVLTFECPSIEGMQVHGHDEQTGVTRVSGRALKRNNWEFISHYYDQDQDQDQGQPEPLTTSEQFSIANLYIGMTLDEARQTLGDLYSNVRYRDRRRVLVAGTQGCGSRRARLEARRNAENQHCMRAWFSDDRRPRLQRLLLVQRVEGDQRLTGVQTLRERFGRPVSRTYHDPSDRHQQAGFGEISRLRWGEQVASPKNGKGSHELEADLISNEYSTELILRLQGQVSGGTQQSANNPFVY